jgi:hypothetical protein
MGENWADIRSLLAFSTIKDKLESLKPEECQNLGFDGQLILTAPPGSILYTPGRWQSDRLNGRRCLRDHFASTVELALAQKQLYEAFRQPLERERGRLPLLKGRPLQEIRVALSPAIPFALVDTLHTVLEIQGALRSPGEDIAGWRRWYDAIVSAVFPDRETAEQLIGQVNELYVGIGANARARVDNAISTILNILKSVPQGAGTKG